MFSGRLPPHLARNRLTEALDAARAAGRPIIDLTLSNPTRAGFAYPADLLAPLADPRALVSRARSRSVFSRRDRRFARLRSGTVSTSRRIGSSSPASTSDAYSRSCSSCSRIPATRSSCLARAYPLFDHLTALEARRDAAA